MKFDGTIYNCISDMEYDLKVETDCGTLIKYDLEPSKRYSQERETTTLDFVFNCGDWVRNEIESLDVDEFVEFEGIDEYEILTLSLERVE